MPGFTILTAAASGHRFRGLPVGHGNGVLQGRNGLELIAALVTQNIIGEASRIGFGSALATIMLLISSVFVVVYLNIVFREDKQ